MNEHIYRTYLQIHLRGQYE